MSETEILMIDKKTVADCFRAMAQIFSERANEIENSGDINPDGRFLYTDGGEAGSQVNPRHKLMWSVAVALSADDFAEKLRLDLMEQSKQHIGMATLHFSDYPE